MMNIVWPIAALYAGRRGAAERVRRAKAPGTALPGERKPFWRTVGLADMQRGSGCALGERFAQWLIVLAPPGRLAAVLVSLVLLLASCAGQPHVFGGTQLSPPQPAPEIQLTDQNGQPFALSTQRGAVVLLFFGYTNCPDACPATLGSFAVVRRELGAAAEHVRFVFITVDPGRDTAAALRAYLNRVDPAIVGLTGAPAAIARTEHDYGVYSAIDRLNSVSHTEKIFLIDQAGNWSRLYGFDVDPAVLAADVRELLRS